MVSVRNTYCSLLLFLLSVTVTHLIPPPWAGNRRRPQFRNFEIDAEISIEGPEIQIFPSFKPGRGPPPHARPPWRRGGRGHPGGGPRGPRPDFHEDPYEEKPIYVRPRPQPNVNPVRPRPQPSVTPVNPVNHYPNVNVNVNVNIEEVCGITHNSRIVGGVNAHPNKWTWMAALIKTDEKQSYCGGSLITKRHVLTAAHCVDKLSPKDMFVRLGSYDFSENADAAAEDINVKSFYIHPEFDKYSYLNDIAIIFLEKEAAFSDYVRPICLPPLRRKFFGNLATVIGWGYQTYGGGDRSDKLREVTVPIWNNTDCNQAYKRDFTEKVLCAGYVEGGKDSCQGDSGGPLMVQTARRKWCIVGIVSFGQNCGEPGYPGVYTRVSEFNSWIKRTIQESEENER